MVKKVATFHFLQILPKVDWHVVLASGCKKNIGSVLNCMKKLTIFAKIEDFVIVIFATKLCKLTPDLTACIDRPQNCVCVTLLNGEKFGM